MWLLEFLLVSFVCPVYAGVWHVCVDAHANRDHGRNHRNMLCWEHKKTNCLRGSQIVRARICSYLCSLTKFVFLLYSYTWHIVVGFRNRFRCTIWKSLETTKWYITLKWCRQKWTAKIFDNTFGSPHQNVISNIPYRLFYTEITEIRLR